MLRCLQTQIKKTCAALQHQLKIEIEQLNEEIDELNKACHFKNKFWVKQEEATIQRVKRIPY